MSLARAAPGETRMARMGHGFLLFVVFGPFVGFAIHSGQGDHSPRH